MFIKCLVKVKIANKIVEIKDKAINLKVQTGYNGNFSNIYSYIIHFFTFPITLLF